MTFRTRSRLRKSFGKPNFQITCFRKLALSRLAKWTQSNTFELTASHYNNYLRSIIHEESLNCYTGGFMQWQRAKATIQKTYYQFNPLVMRYYLFENRYSACVLFQMLFESKKQLSSRNSVFG